jgi:hypothetical protein
MRKSLEEVDRQVFDEQSSIFPLLNLEDPRPGIQRVGLDLPLAFLARLDQAAEERGITRQALLKCWLFDRLAVENGARANVESASGAPT